MNITFTLTPETSGVTQSGNYNISGTTSGGALNGVLIANNVTRAQLTTGYTAVDLIDTLTGGTITSTGSASGGYCTNQIYWLVGSGGAPAGTTRVICQLIYTNIAGGDVITVSNNSTNGTTDEITSVGGTTVYGSNRCFVDSATGTTVTFQIQKTFGNGLDARDNGTVELRVNLNPVDSYNFVAGGSMNGVLTGAISPGDLVVIEIMEG